MLVVFTNMLNAMHNNMNANNSISGINNMINSINNNMHMNSSIENVMNSINQ